MAPPILAVWSSRGAKWTAVLYKAPFGYRLSERKHNLETGSAFRPASMFASEQDAIQFFHLHVMTVFDVPMKRIVP